MAATLFDEARDRSSKGEKRATRRGLVIDPADPAVLAMEAELLRELTRSAPLQEAS